MQARAARRGALPLPGAPLLQLACRQACAAQALRACRARLVSESVLSFQGGHVLTALLGAAWLPRLCRKRITEGGLDMPAPILSTLYSSLQKGLEAFEQCRCATGRNPARVLVPAAAPRSSKVACLLAARPAAACGLRLPQLMPLSWFEVPGRLLAGFPRARHTVHWLPAAGPSPTDVLRPSPLQLLV